ncbi:hypothetical protein ES703_108277 [subsurface metagenome]
MVKFLISAPSAPSSSLKPVFRPEPLLYPTPLVITDPPPTAPIIATSLFTIAPAYSPAATLMVSPGSASSIAAWIVAYSLGTSLSVPTAPTGTPMTKLKLSTSTRASSTLNTFLFIKILILLKWIFIPPPHFISYRPSPPYGGRVLTQITVMAPHWTGFNLVLVLVGKAAHLCGDSQQHPLCFDGYLPHAHFPSTLPAFLFYFSLTLPKFLRQPGKSPPKHQEVNEQSGYYHTTYNPTN